MRHQGAILVLATYWVTFHLRISGTILSTKPHFFSSFLPSKESPDRPRGVGQTATPHLSPFLSGGRWCILAWGSDLPGMHQECAPYPIFFIFFDENTAHSEVVYEGCRYLGSCVSKRSKPS